VAYTKYNHKNDYKFGESWRRSSGMSNHSSVSLGRERNCY